MLSEVIEVTPIVRQIKISYSAEEVGKKFKDATKKIALKVTLKGFRPGKAPLSIIEQQYRYDIHTQVLDDLINQGYYQTLNEHKLYPVSQAQPIFDEDKEKSKPLVLGQPFEMRMQFYIQPKIELNADYKNLKITQEKSQLTDEDVTKRIEEIRKQAAQLVPITDRDALEKEDYAELNYDITIDGKPYLEKPLEGVLVRVHESELFSGLVDKIIGMQPNSQREFDLEYPEDYHNKELASKTAHVKVELKQIKKLDLPALDDEFAKDVGFENFEALKEKTKKDLLAFNEQSARNKIRDEIVDQLLEKHSFEVPPNMVDEQKEIFKNNFLQRMKSYNMTDAQITQEMKDKIEEDAKKSADRMVRSALLLKTISQQEKIEVTEKEVHDKIHDIAHQTGQNERHVHAYFAENNRMAQLHYELMEEKVFSFLAGKNLAENGQIEENKVESAAV